MTSPRKLKWCKIYLKTGKNISIIYILRVWLPVVFKCWILICFNLYGKQKCLEVWMASKTQYYWTQMIFLSHNHLLNIFIQQVSSNKNSTKLSNFITLYISIILQKYNFILKSNIIITRNIAILLLILQFLKCNSS